MFNLVKAVSIVIIVLLLTMGRKTGMIIGVVLFLTIMATFLVMFIDGNILMERISLGALIIALCMLTDNAIIVIEGVKVRIEAGEDKLEVVRDVVAQNQWPLFGATAIGVIAFAAIGLSEDSTGEYCNSLFWVILIALSLSWVSSVTITPLLGYIFFKPLPTGTGGKSPADPYAGGSFRRIARCSSWHCVIGGGVVAGLVVAFVTQRCTVFALWIKAFSRQRRGRSLWWTCFYQRERTFARPKRLRTRLRNTCKRRTA